MSRAEVNDRMLGAWVGKAYGVTLGGATEFKALGKIYEDSAAITPHWLARVTSQDDIYLNFAFLKVYADKQEQATAEDYGDAVRTGGFLLWHGNGQARQNLLQGVPAESCGHPLYNPHADDIDFQIESDFVGLLSPGMPEESRRLANKVGSVIGHGDGLYGGQFVASMYAAAFVYGNVRQIIDSALSSIPRDSRYARVIRDAIRLHDTYPDSWRHAWKELDSIWNEDRCPWGAWDRFNITAALNGAYVVIGLLYGDGHFDETLEIAMRCGQDSDCNPATAAGILGTLNGYSRLPSHVRAALDSMLQKPFTHTTYSLRTAAEACAELAESRVVRNGGRISGDSLHIHVERFWTDEPAASSFGEIRIADSFLPDDKRLKWSGEWSHHGGEEPNREATSVGASLTVQFVGTAIYVQGDMRYDCGILEFSLDGQAVQRRDMYLPKKWRLAIQSTAVWLTGLEDRHHSLTIRVTGEQSSQSQGKRIALGKIVSYRPGKSVQ